jgi:hypothetical protein
VLFSFHDAHCTGGGIALLIKLSRHHQEKTVGEDRQHTNTRSASCRVEPARGELHGPYGQTSFQRRDRGDLAAHYHFVGLEPGASWRARFCSHVDGGCRQLSLGIFCRPRKPAKPSFRPLPRDDRPRLSRPERRLELSRFADLHGACRRWGRRISPTVASDSVGRVSGEARLCVGCTR